MTMSKLTKSFKSAWYITITDLFSAYLLGVYWLLARDSVPLTKYLFTIIKMALPFGALWSR